MNLKVTAGGLLDSWDKRVRAKQQMKQSPHTERPQIVADPAWEEWKNKQNKRQAIYFISLRLFSQKMFFRTHWMLQEWFYSVLHTRYNG